MMEPATIITATKAGVDAIKKAIEIADNLNNLELKSAILQLKENILELRQENIDLKEALSKIEKKNSEKETLFFERNVYWKNEGEKRIGPFCSGCFDKDEKIIRLKIGDYVWVCPICNSAEEHTKRPKLSMDVNRGRY